VPQSYVELQNAQQISYEVTSLMEDPSVFGLYFDKFDGKSFKPNKHLAYVYPWSLQEKQNQK